MIYVAVILAAMLAFAAARWAAVPANRDWSAMLRGAGVFAQTPMPGDAPYIEVSADGGTTFVSIGLIQNHDSQRGREGANQTKVYGGAVFTSGGRKTTNITFGGLFDPADPGLVAIQTAYNNDTTLVTNVRYGSATAAGYQETCTVDGYADNSDANQDFWQFGVTLVGDGARTPVTAA